MHAYLLKVIQQSQMYQMLITTLISLIPVIKKNELSHACTVIDGQLSPLESSCNENQLFMMQQANFVPSGCTPRILLLPFVLQAFPNT